MSRGQGIGKGGARQYDGGPTRCVCPSCGYSKAHTRGNPCTGLVCPKCGAGLVGR